MSDILMRKVAIQTLFIQQTDNIQHVLVKSIQSWAEVMGNCQCGSYYLSMRWKFKREIKCEQVRWNINRAEEGLKIRTPCNTHTFASIDSINRTNSLYFNRKICSWINIPVEANFFVSTIHSNWSEVALSQSNE